MKKRYLLLMALCLATGCSSTSEKAYVDKPADGMYRQMHDLFSESASISITDQTKQTVKRNGVEDSNGTINSVATIEKTIKNGEKKLAYAADFDYFTFYVKDNELYLNILNIGKVKITLDDNALETLHQLPFIPDYDITHMQNIKKQVNGDTATITFDLSNMHLNGLLINYLTEETIVLDEIEYTIRQSHATVQTDLLGNLISWQSLIDVDAKYGDEVITFYQEKEINCTNTTESTIVFPDDLDTYELIDEQGGFFDETIIN